jgi:hypothetical protein
MNTGQGHGQLTQPVQQKYVLRGKDKQGKSQYDGIWGPSRTAKDRGLCNCTSILSV